MLDVCVWVMFSLIQVVDFSSEIRGSWIQVVQGQLFPEDYPREPTFLALIHPVHTPAVGYVGHILAE